MNIRMFAVQELLQRQSSLAALKDDIRAYKQRGILPSYFADFAPHREAKFQKFRLLHLAQSGTWLPSRRQPALSLKYGRSRGGAVGLERNVRLMPYRVLLHTAAMLY